MTLTVATARPVLREIDRSCRFVAARYDRRRRRIVLTINALIAPVIGPDLNRWHSTPHPGDAVETAKRMEAFIVGRLA